MKIIWVYFNSFPLIKCTSSYWVYIDFILISYHIDLKKCTQSWVFWVNLNLIKIKSAWSVKFNEHTIIFVSNDQGCAGVESTVLFSAVGLRQSALYIRLRRYTSPRNNWKYIDRRSNFVTTGKKIMNEL